MQYHAPSSISSAIELLSADTQEAPTRVLAGGTDLLVQLRAGMISPASIIDIKKIPETTATSITKDGVFVGAAVSGAEFNENKTLKALWPGVAEAFDLIGSTQVQGRASLGGNLCNASPAADSVPALIAAGVIAHIVGPEGEKKIPVENINTGPGKNCLKAGEFIVSFEFPNRPQRSGDAYLRMTPRTEMDIAVVGVGVNVTLDQSGKCTHARVGLGAVAPRALLVEAAANTLIGTTIDEVALNNLQQAISNACSPIDDKRGTIEYRTKVAGVIAKRTTIIARNRALAAEGDK
ncbi:MAG: xanthine dehydrogenase family protein subunit M [Cellvibrionaceae bacterium]